MARPFAHSTAELVIQAADAVQANRRATVTLVEAFCGLSRAQAESALKLAVDLSLLSIDGADYVPRSPLARFVATPDESRKAALLRVVLESFEPFVVFRERLLATGSADQAAQQTKTMLDLEAHREDIKDTILSLGTYSGALASQGGGRYTAAPPETANPLAAVAEAATDQAQAEGIIRSEIGARSDQADRAEVIFPLASALLKANARDPSGAVTDASKAVESFLARLANRMGVSLAGANGIGQKLECFRAGNHLPKKVVEAAKYLGQVRNAGEHGVDVDPDVGAVWHIQPSTGRNYVFVACAFISAALDREAGGPFCI